MPATRMYGRLASSLSRKADVSRKQKIELTWIGKENRPKLEPRIVLEGPAKSYHAKHRVTETGSFDNRLIFGGELVASKAGVAAT